MIHVIVTQEDIDVKYRSDCRKCPVAKAIARATGMPFVSVGMLWIAIGKDRLEFDLISIPDEIDRRIKDFDFHALMEPFEFDLPYEVPA